MNQTQRRTYSSQSKRVQRRSEVLFIAGVYRALINQTKFFIRLARENGVQYAINRMPLMDDNMAKVIESIHLVAGKFAARETRKKILLDVARSAAANEKGANAPLTLKRGGFGFNERMVNDIREYFRLHLLEKAVLPISATTKARIETVLNRAVEEGWGVDRIIQELESEEYRDMTRRRARMIVRTETVRASNYGALAAAHDSEFEQEKIWIAINDPRTRRTHNHVTGVDDERRDLLAPFSNGLMFPGDPNGPAKETINCRCTIAFKAKRDARGRLIPKKREGLLVSLASSISSVYRRIAAILSSYF
jgi:hypothetical protein